MEKNQIVMYNNRAYGVKVSDYGIENGRLDYLALSNIVGEMILNNNLRASTMEDWELYSGDWDGDVVFQDYIISEQGANILAELSDELIFYNEKIHMYIWAITHYGTGWDYVLTNIELVENQWEEQ